MTIKASSFPTVRPSLDLNFAQTKRLDPRVTFSRASSATFVDVDGLIKSAATNAPRFDHAPTTGESLGLLVEEARTNSLAFSERYSVSSWTKQGTTVRDNAALAPDGTFTAASLTETAATSSFYAAQFFLTVTANTTHTFSLFAKGDGSGRLLNLTLQTDAGYLQSYFNLSTGTVSNVSAGLTASIQAVNNGWYRCLVTATTGSTNCTPFIYIAAAAGENSVYAVRTGNGVSGILVWGAMREQGSFPTSYIPTPATFTGRASIATYYDANGVIQTAGSGVARSAAFFPDSAGVFRSAGLLLEAAGTNYIYSSNPVNTTNWSVAATFTATSTTAPDGTSINSLSNSPRSVNVDIGAVTKTLSFFVKADTATTGSFQTIGGGWSTDAGTYAFDLTARTFSGGTVQPVGNGWFRLSRTFGTASSGTLGNIFNCAGLFLWGVQFEAGSFPTSYIPTTTTTVTRAADTSTSSTVTRSADVASITGTNFSSWYNYNQGTTFFATRLQIPANNFSHGFLSEENGNQFRCGIYSGSWIAWRPGDNIGPTSPVVSGLNKGAFCYDRALSTQSRCFNSTTPTNANSSIPLSPTSVPIAYAVGSVQIARLTYWPTRLSDATLQAITR